MNTRQVFISKVHNVLTHFSSRKEALDNIKALMDSHHLSKMDCEYIKKNQPFVFNLMVAIGSNSLKWTTTQLEDDAGHNGEEFVFYSGSGVQVEDVKKPKCECGWSGTPTATKYSRQHSSWCDFYKGD